MTETNADLLRLELGLRNTARGMALVFHRDEDHMMELLCRTIDGNGRSARQLASLIQGGDLTSVLQTHRSLVSVAMSRWEAAGASMNKNPSLSEAVQDLKLELVEQMRLRAFADWLSRCLESFGPAFLPPRPGESGLESQLRRQRNRWALVCVGLTAALAFTWTQLVLW